jgi:GntR family transcriptional regulator
VQVRSRPPLRLHRVPVCHKRCRCSYCGNGSYYRPRDVEGTRLVDPTPGPAGRGGGFLVLTLQGLEPDRITENFYARMPTPTEVEQLELPAGEPVMVLQRRTATADGRVVEFARGVHAASRFSWSYNFKIPD